MIVRRLNSWTQGRRAPGVYTLDDPLEHETLLVLTAGSMLHRATQQVVSAGTGLTFAPGEVMDLIALEETADWVIDFTE